MRRSIRNCEKYQNRTITLDGNAKSRVLYVARDAGVELVNLNIKNGNVNGDGGGICNYYGTFKAKNVVVFGNAANCCYVGICDVEILKATNLVVWGNVAKWGGGLYCSLYSSGDSSVTNVIVAGNVALESGGGIYNAYTAKLYNAIVAYNKAASDDVYSETGDDVEGRSVISNFAQWTAFDHVARYSSTSKVFVVAPKFNSQGQLSNASKLDLRLCADSLGLDWGNNSYISADVKTDAVGNARIQNGTVDIGAYEDVGTTVGDPLKAPTI